MVDADFKEYSNLNISFHYQDILPFKNDERNSTEWITTIVKDSGASISSLNYIFCDDEQLHKINLEHLNHDTYTDIITFDYSDETNIIESDIYVSLDRVVENAKELGKDFYEELHRVLIHGVLHLVGYKDKTKSEKEAMREKENACLSLRK